MLGLALHSFAVVDDTSRSDSRIDAFRLFDRNGPIGADTSWDAHHAMFADRQNRRMPANDWALVALLGDLGARGSPDETLNHWAGVVGRTPRIGHEVARSAGVGHNGRDHWPPCLSTSPANAGIGGGIVSDTSDRRVTRPARDFVSSADIAATVCHLLDIGPTPELADSLGRSLRLCPGIPTRRVLG